MLLPHVPNCTLALGRQCSKSHTAHMCHTSVLNQFIVDCEDQSRCSSLDDVGKNRGMRRQRLVELKPEEDGIGLKVGNWRVPSLWLHRSGCLSWTHGHRLHWPVGSEPSATKAARKCIFLYFHIFWTRGNAGLTTLGTGSVKRAFPVQFPRKVTIVAQTGKSEYIEES